MDTDEDLIRDLRAQVDRVERRLRRSRGAGAEAPAAMARYIYECRGLIGTFLPAGLFGDPAWDILLDLYVARSEDREISVSSACAAGRVPATTGLRWLDRLEVAGLISRRPAANDRRRVLVELTEEAIPALEQLLAAIASKRR